MFIHGTDKKLFWTIIILFIGGILILSSASIVLSERNYGTFYFYTLRQILLGGVAGVIGGAIAMRIPYRLWRKAAVPMMIASFFILALLFIPQFSFTHGGARRSLPLRPI